MKKRKVFLTGGDGIGWALDEDLKLTRQSIAEYVEMADLENAEVVHSVWWEGLLHIPEEKLDGKQVICHIPAEPYRYLALPQHRHVMALVNHWVVRNQQALHQMQAIRKPTTLIPYTVATDIFHPLPIDDPDVAALREQWAIPTDQYLIGNFHRDTEGHSLDNPKLVKGPDIFLEILIGLKKRGCQFHVILAGPRRHWIRKQLSEHGISYTFIGQTIDKDDLEANLLTRQTLNMLYSLLNINIVSSRSEGGPQTIMEAAAARCPLISTPVGLAPDILEPSCIYTLASQAVQQIKHDLDTGWMKHTLTAHYDRIQAYHTPVAVKPLFHKLYEQMDDIPGFTATIPKVTSSRKRYLQRFNIIKRLSPRRVKPFTVGLWHQFFKPPYGGGNQFMMALRRELLNRGIGIEENTLKGNIDAYLLNAIHFDIDLFSRKHKKQKLSIVHRIDGPIHLIRGFDREKDELTYELNARLASATVIQSTWTYQRIVEFGYQPVNPVIIHNAVDSAIFHPNDRINFDSDRKIRLISSSWSDNPRKGGPIYKWIEENLDWDRFEYTFVGRASETFNRIRQVDPVPSEQLAGLLRQHDIYITASQNDPCSNAVIEALSCGLPTLYLNDGGHPELVGHGGLPFTENDEILSQLDVLAENYEMYQNLIVVSKLEDVAQKYLTLLKESTQQ